MSVREYIGARYVPLFADPIEWDNTKTYEPLTIVYYQGNSYTSRQAVPTGIAITNTTFWALTGNYNAQIEAYRTEVQEYSDDVSELNEQIEVYREEVQEFSNDISKLNEALPLTAFDETHTVDARFDTIEADDWVTTSRIDDDAVTAPKIAYNAIGSSHLSDGSVTLSKLSLQLQSKLGLYVTPEEYGAVGDGVTDDTQAFETMLDSILGGTVVLLPQTKEYLISDTLNITKNQIAFISFAEMEYQPKIKFVNTTTGLNVTGFGFSMHNIQLWGESTSANTTLLVLNRDTVDHAGNIDAYISNCAFQYSGSFIRISGRNVKIINNLFSQNLNLGIVIEQTQNITIAMRGFVITGNRFHDVRIAVTNNITSYADEGCGIKISDNYCDGCNVLYIGASDNVVITDNFFSRPTVEATNIISMNKTIDEKTTCTIANNTINGVQSYTGNYPRTAIALIDNVEGVFLITGNYASTKAQNAHIVMINTQNNIIVNMTNNIFLNYTRTSTITPTTGNNIKGLIANNIFNGNVTGYSNCTVSNNINASLTA
ncbi:MAG: hypothetical protein IKB96_03095 [Prevotella sp.]|nr:hypothetical protein [Prevotella sp.]